MPLFNGDGNSFSVLEVVIDFTFTEEKVIYAKMHLKIILEVLIYEDFIVSYSEVEVVLWKSNSEGIFIYSLS